MQWSVQADVGNLRPFVTSSSLIMKKLWVSGGQAAN